MEIVTFEEIDDEWERLVRESFNGTIFHSLKFLNYHPQGKFDFLNLALKDRGELLCLLPGARDKERRAFVSPVGASFGGFIFREKSLKLMIECMCRLTSWLFENRFDVIEIAPEPLCYRRHADESVEFALAQAGYTPCLWDATQVVEVGTFTGDRIDPVLRRNLRKAEKSGIRVRETDDVASFYRILLRNLKTKGVTPTHSEEEINILRSLFPDNVKILGAFVDAKMVGGCLILVCNQTAALTFYICDDPEWRQLRTTDAVLTKAIEVAAQLGCRYLDLGTVSKNGVVNWGLLRFKSKFGGLTFLRRRYRRKRKDANN